MDPATTSTIVNNAILSDLDISLHPLPILNISDHFTRTSLQSGSDTTPIYGALIGTLIGRKIEIVNSFEIPIKDGQVDHGFTSTRQEQFKQVFPTLDLLGWYAVGHQPELPHLQIQEQLLQYSESPSQLLLLYSSRPVTVSADSSDNSSKDLPVEMFEFVGHEHNTAGSADSSRPPAYVKCTYAVETSEAERIAVDYVAKPNVGSKESAFVANLTTQRNAIKMLHSRLQVILKYLDSVVESCSTESAEADKPAGKSQLDHEALRQISSLMACLPNARDNKPFMKEYATERDDALLTSYLSTQTKTLNQANQLVDKYIYLVTREQNDAKEHAPHVGHNSRYNTRAMQKGDIIGSSKRSGGRMH